MAPQTIHPNPSKFNCLGICVAAAPAAKAVKAVVSSFHPQALVLPFPDTEGRTRAHARGRGLVMEVENHCFDCFDCFHPYLTMALAALIRSRIERLALA